MSSAVRSAVHRVYARCMLHVALPKEHIKQSKPVQQNRTGPKSLLSLYIYCDHISGIFFFPLILSKRSQNSPQLQTGFLMIPIPQQDKYAKLPCKKTKRMTCLGQVSPPTQAQCTVLSFQKVMKNYLSLTSAKMIWQKIAFLTCCHWLWENVAI